METKRKQLTCVVVSDKMDKSRVVAHDRKKSHPLYGKYVKIRKKYMIHDEKNESKKGDTVLIEESRPLSKSKRWVLIQVVSKAE
ncbi:MAG: 30S ribosomal protein S17 [Spirochaetes bacterium GWF1_51_8]|nr:MAG: 30S ribosomal protein S17 [Spirochaetes bacterium GWF1_51_8]